MAGPYIISDLHAIHKLKDLSDKIRAGPSMYMTTCGNRDVLLPLPTSNPGGGGGALRFE